MVKKIIIGTVLAFLIILLPVSASYSPLLDGDKVFHCSSDDQCNPGYYCSKMHDLFLQGNACCPSDGTVHTYFNPLTKLCIAVDCIDKDGDGYGAFGGKDCLYPGMIDCDDNDPLVNPGQLRTSGQDNRCSYGSELPEEDSYVYGQVSLEKKDSPPKKESYAYGAISLEESKDRPAEPSPGSNCYEWEIPRGSACVLAFPDLDQDGDGVLTKVEVRYWSNPLMKEDDPYNRMMQKGCPGYFRPLAGPMTSSSIYVGPVKLGSNYFLITSLNKISANTLGNTVGMPHGIVEGVWTDVSGVAELVWALGGLAVEFGAYNIETILSCGGSNICVMSQMGHSTAQGAGSMVQTLIQANYREMYYDAKNDWFDKRSTFARKIWEYPDECNNVILTRTYTSSYSKGFVAAQVALLLVPVSKVSGLSKAKLLAKFKATGRLHSKGAKIIDGIGEFSWLSKLPEDEAQKVAGVIGDVAERYGNDVAKKIAARTSKLYPEAAAKFVSNLEKIYGLDPRLVDDIAKISHLDGVDSLVNNLANIKSSGVLRKGYTFEIRGNRILLEDGKRIEEVSRLIPGGEIDALLKNGDIIEFKQGWLHNHPLSDDGAALIEGLNKKYLAFDQFQKTAGKGRQKFVYTDVQPHPEMVEVLKRKGWKVEIIVNSKLIKELTDEISKKHGEDIGRLFSSSGILGRSPGIIIGLGDDYTFELGVLFGRLNKAETERLVNLLVKLDADKSKTLIDLANTKPGVLAELSKISEYQGFTELFLSKSEIDYILKGIKEAEFTHLFSDDNFIGLPQKYQIQLLGKMGRYTEEAFLEGWVIYRSNNFVYRGTKLESDKHVFTNGFKASNPNYRDVYKHVSTGAESAFISASKSSTQSEFFAGKYGSVFEINPRARNGIDVVDTLKYKRNIEKSIGDSKWDDLVREQEISFLDDISPQDIRGVWKTDGAGKIIPETYKINPNYLD